MTTVQRRLEAVKEMRAHLYGRTRSRESLIDMRRPDSLLRRFDQIASVLKWVDLEELEGSPRHILSDLTTQLAVSIADAKRLRGYLIQSQNVILRGEQPPEYGGFPQMESNLVILETSLGQWIGLVLPSLHELHAESEAIVSLVSDSVRKIGGNPKEVGDLTSAALVNAEALVDSLTTLQNESDRRAKS